MKKKAEPNIEFVSPYPLEDCVWQLQNFPGVGESFPVETRVIFAERREENTYEFKIEKSYYHSRFLHPSRPFVDRNNRSIESLYLKLCAVGTLKSMPSYETIVVGNVSICSKTSFIKQALAFILGCIILAVVVSLFKDAQFLSFIILVAVLLPIIYWGYIATPNTDHFRNMLASDIKRLLQN